MIEQIVELMKQKPYLLNMGAGKLAKMYSTTREIIYRAKATARNDKPTVRKSIPKILIFDIETSPLRAYVWRRWKENISLDQTISEWFCISWSAKWLFSAETMSDVLTSEEILNEDDSRIIKSLWNLVNEADILIAHNGKNFDIPKINSRFLMNGLQPPKPYQQIDTLDVVRKQFGFSSNRLDALAGYFGIDHKLSTGFELWAKCMNGDKEALEYMNKYNEKDVEILEEVYLKLRPWIKNHPNVGMYIDSNEPVCANCGGNNLTKIEGYHYTQTAKYELYRCDCGAVSRGRVNVLPKEKMKSLITRIPK